MLNTHQEYGVTSRHIRCSSWDKRSTPYLVCIARFFFYSVDWRRGTDMPFPMHDYIQSVEVEGTLYVGGGLADKAGNMYIVMAYDTQSCKWHTLPPYSAQKFAMTTIHNKLVLVGERYLGVWQTDSNQWTCPFPPMPTHHYNSPSATSYKHWLVVAGGSSFNTLSNVDVLNVDNNQWSTGPSIPTPLRSMKSTTIGDTWYLMGGYDDWGIPIGGYYGGYYISLETLVSHSATDGSNLWRELPSTNYSYSCPLNIEGSLLAFGGWDEEKRYGVSTIQRYVPETNTWVAAGELPLGVYGCTCIMTSGKLYVIGGHDVITRLKSTYTTDIQF